MTQFQILQNLDQNTVNTGPKYKSIYISAQIETKMRDLRIKLRDYWDTVQLKLFCISFSEVQLYTVYNSY